MAKQTSGGGWENVVELPGPRAPVRQTFQPGDPLPANVRRLRPARPPAPPQDAPLPVTGYVLLAMIEALRQPPEAWAKTGGPDVLGELVRLHQRWEEDPEVSLHVRRAVDLLLARKTAAGEAAQLTRAKPGPGHNRRGRSVRPA